MTLSNVPAWSTTAASNPDIAGVTLDPAVTVASQLISIQQNTMAQIASFTRRGSDTATAATLNLDTTPNEMLDLTGTTTVTAVTLTATHSRRARAAGIFQITASANLIVNNSSSVNYTTSAGDLLFFEGYSTGVVRVWALSGGTASAASAADVWTGTNSAKFTAPSILLGALAEVSLTDGATVTVDFQTGINFKLDTIGGNRTLAAANVANALGRSGYIRVKQDGTGSRTLAVSSSPWVSAGGVDVALSTAASAVDMLFYVIISSTQVLLSPIKAVS